MFRLSVLRTQTRVVRTEIGQNTPTVDATARIGSIEKDERFQKLGTLINDHPRNLPDLKSDTYSRLLVSSRASLIVWYAPDSSVSIAHRNRPLGQILPFLISVAGRIAGPSA